MSDDNSFPPLNHRLIEDWRTCNLESPPYLFPGDKPEMLNARTSIYRNFDEYITSPKLGDSDDKTLHVSLLPVPYAGNLAKASIFVLMLNPGLSPGDYFAEQHSPEFKQAHIRNLRQENENDEYPFIFLNPQFAGILALYIGKRSYTRLLKHWLSNLGQRINKQ